MIASRKAFATADIRWTLDSKGLPKRYRRSRYDGRNWTYEEVGDPDGIVRPGKVGQPGSCTELRFLNTDGLRWMVAENSAQVSLWEAKADRHGVLPLAVRPNLDVRTVGIAPESTETPLDALLPSIIEGVPDSAFSVKDTGGGVVAVTVKLQHSTLTWWLDTQRAFNPIRIELRSNEKGEPLLTVTLIDLSIYDNHVWFPSRVTRTSINKRTSQQSIATYEFHGAEFDRPEHPPVLAPAHIGVLPYDTIAWQRPVGRPVECWDGKGFLSIEEVTRKRASGELLPEMLSATKEKAQRIAFSDKGRYPAWLKDPNYGITKPADVDEWEKYVRRFCLIRKCDDRQKASAKSILDGCRKTAVPLLAKIKESLAKEKDAARNQAMLTPIEDIFTKSLVPRLEALLTVAQSQPTSQPVTIQRAIPTTSQTRKQ